MATVCWASFCLKTASNARLLRLRLRRRGCPWSIAGAAGGTDCQRNLHTPWTWSSTGFDSSGGVAEAASLAHTARTDNPAGTAPVRIAVVASAVAFVVVVFVVVEFVVVEFAVVVAFAVVAAFVVVVFAVVGAFSVAGLVAALAADDYGCLPKRESIVVGSSTCYARCCLTRGQNRGCLPRDRHDRL